MKRGSPLIVWLVLMLVACTGQATPTIYMPATPADTPVRSTPTSILPAADSSRIPTSPQPSPSPDCQSNLLFLEDVTIPDGSQVSPQESLDKRWLVRNSGSCNWDHRFSLRLIAGPDLDANPEISLFPARSGTEAEIQVIFTAPVEPGAYRSAWQAVDPDGDLFGDPIFIEIVVQNP